MPWRFRSSKICPRQGLLTIATIGFGRLIVRGRRRLPSPPAMTTACMSASLGAFGWLFGADGEEGFEVVTRIHLERHVGVGAQDAGYLADPLRDDLVELIDRELHAVPRGGADHGHPPDDCVSDEDIGRTELARGRGDDRAGAQDGEGPAIGRVGMAARLVPHLEAAMRVVVGQQLDERVQDLVHLAGRYRPRLAATTPTGGSAVPLAGETGSHPRVRESGGSWWSWSLRRP